MYFLRSIMCYTTKASSQKQLIESMHSKGIIGSPLVFKTLSDIDRKYFVPEPPFYNDSPSSIGYGATISAPHMHAYALEAL